MHAQSVLIHIHTHGRSPTTANPIVRSSDNLPMCSLVLVTMESQVVLEMVRVQGLWMRIVRTQGLDASSGLR